MQSGREESLDRTPCHSPHRHGDTSRSKARSKPSASNTMGLGLHASQQVLRSFLSWLATSHQVPFPTIEEHILDYLEIKVQEPCTRSALKATKALCSWKSLRLGFRSDLGELLSKTRPGAQPKQAPRPLLWVLDEAVFIRLYAWFYLLQTWCSLRFDDHRGVEPGLLRNTEHSLTGVLTRSETHGLDKKIQRKPIFLDKSCWIAVKDWCDVGSISCWNCTV